MAKTYDGTLERPNGKFIKDDPHWLNYIYQLAYQQGMLRRDVAAKCGVPPATFSKHEQVIAAWQEGYADHRATIYTELLNFALAEPADYDDPIERSSVRSAKLDAVKTITKIFEKRDEMEQVKEEMKETRGALARLTDEELRAKAKELLER